MPKFSLLKLPRYDPLYNPLALSEFSNLNQITSKPLEYSEPLDLSKFKQTQIQKRDYFKNLDWPAIKPRSFKYEYQPVTPKWKDIKETYFYQSFEAWAIEPRKLWFEELPPIIKYSGAVASYAGINYWAYKGKILELEQYLNKVKVPGGSGPLEIPLPEFPLLKIHEFSAWCKPTSIVWPERYCIYPNVEAKWKWSDRISSRLEIENLGYGIFNNVWRPYTSGYSIRAWIDYSW